VNAWDPSGEISLVETSITMAIIGIVAAVIMAGLSVAFDIARGTVSTAMIISNAIATFGIVALSFLVWPFAIACLGYASYKIVTASLKHIHGGTDFSTIDKVQVATYLFIALMISIILRNPAVASQIASERMAALAASKGVTYSGTARDALAQDVQKALQEIETNVPRPNVRYPKPFANDGRGGTPRLPTQDSTGQAISYTEHTVNPRSPGASLDGLRIVTGSDGSVYFTDDHFGSWSSVRD
jgi:guanyl-specific ribonuclease Sa